MFGASKSVCWCVSWLLVAFLVSTTRVEAEEDAMTTKEMLEVLSDRDFYDPAIRPTPGGEATEVKLQMFIRDIDIDDVTMRARYDIIFRMKWMDPRLAQFSGLDVGHVRLLDPSVLWVPDAYFLQADVTHHKSIHLETFVGVFKDGNVVYSTRLTVQRKCDGNLRLFPHDAQTCNIEVGSYGYSKKYLTVSMEPNGLDVAFNLSMTSFTLENTVITSQTDSTATGEYDSILVSFNVQREFLPHLLKLYIPAMSLVFISWCSFLVHSEQFLGRLLLTLVPYMMLATLCHDYNQTSPAVPLVRAVDIFTGVSLTVIFAALLLVIRSSSPPAKAADKTSGAEYDKTSHLVGFSQHRLLQQFCQQADLLPCVLTGSYVLFLMLYFTIYLH